MATLLLLGNGGGNILATELFQTRKLRKDAITFILETTDFEFFDKLNFVQPDSPDSGVTQLFNAAVQKFFDDIKLHLDGAAVSAQL